MRASPSDRPRCSVFIAVSVDGFIARPDGGLDWLARVERPDEDYGYAQFASAVDTLIMGRNTYDTALGFESWPYAGKQVAVLTHRESSSCHGEQFYQGRPEGVLARLHASGARHAYVDGGAVIRQFLDAGVIDELTLSVIPILLGSGIPRFATGGREHGLKLREARPYPSGLTQLRYALPA